MERESVVPNLDKEKESNILSKNPRITEIFELIFDHIETQAEMQSILLDFWDKYENLVSQEEDYCEFDVLCMYALEYIYKRNDATRSSISRAVYCSFKQIDLRTENRNSIITCTEECFVKALREFTNFSSTEGENILIAVLIKSLVLGHLGLLQFLVKFGLVEFPCEANEKSRKIVQQLVKWFNAICSISDYFENIPEEEGMSIQLDDLFNQMEQNKTINFRRLIFILCYICIIVEHRAGDKLEMHYNVNMKFFCSRKLECLNLLIKMTTEAFITFKDVHEFLSTILNQQLKEEVRTSLQEYARNIFCETPDCYKPRPLKHLVRSKIRDCLRNSTVLPVEVHQLPLPVSLKEFIVFEEKDIWIALKINQTVLYFLHKIKRILEL